MAVAVCIIGADCSLFTPAEKRTMARFRILFSLIVSCALVLGATPTSAWADQDAFEQNPIAQSVSDPEVGAESVDESTMVPFAELLSDGDVPEVDESGGGTLYVEDEVIVAVSPDESADAIEEALASAGVVPTETIEASSLRQQKPIAVEIADGASVASKIDELMESDGIVYAQPNYLYTADYIPNDPVLSGSRADWWHLDDVGAFKAWDLAKVGRTVRVATIDSGVRTDHLDLKNNIDLGNAYNTVTDMKGCAAAWDAYGHGTHVAGLIAADADNAIGTAGASFNAEIVPINVVYTSGSYAGKSTTADFVEALDYIMRLGDVRVVNISMGTYVHDPALERSVAAAAEKNIVIVGAGGNKGVTDASYPADYADVLSVTWYKSTGDIDSRSDHGAGKDIAAPGTSIYSTLNTGVDAYGMKSGSSMAAPIVSGVCALVLSANPNLTVDQLRQVLYRTAVDAGDLGRDDYFGWGKVDAYAAVVEALTTAPPEQSDITSMELSGADRVATSIAVAKAAYPSGPCGIVLVRADDFPDALAASTLAGAKGYPVVSCWPKSLSPAVADYLKNTPSITEVILVGGTNSLSSSVERSVASLVSSSSRIQGIDRYDTARLLREAAARAGAQSDIAVIARGDDFPDALSMSSFTASTGSPLFLISPSATPDSATLAELARYRQVLILGGYGSVSNKVDAALSGASIPSMRLAGGIGNGQEDSRYGTSAVIADWVVTRSGKGFTYESAVFATALDFPDALAGGPLCAKLRTPVLLVDSGGYAAVGPAALSGQVRSVYWLGSENTLSASVRAAVLSILRA